MTKIEALEKLARHHINASVALCSVGSSWPAFDHKKEAARLANLIATMPDAELQEDEEPQTNEEQ